MLNSVLEKKRSSNGNKGSRAVAHCLEKLSVGNTERSIEKLRFSSDNIICWAIQSRLTLNVLF